MRTGAAEAAPTPAAAEGEAPPAEAAPADAAPAEAAEPPAEGMFPIVPVVMIIIIGNDDD